MCINRTFIRTYGRIINMLSTKNMFFVFIIGIFFLITIGSLIGQSFTKSGAEKLQDEAIDLCLEGLNSNNFEVQRNAIKVCSENHPIERYLIDWFDYVIFLVFVMPLLFAVSTTTFLVNWDPFAAKPLSRTEQDKLPKSRDGSLTIASGRSEIGNYVSTKVWIQNVRDIVKRRHICKGDYTAWFQRLAVEYIENHPYSDGSVRKYVSKDEVIRHLEWAISTLPLVYYGSDKEIKSGERRKKILHNFINKLEKL